MTDSRGIIEQAPLSPPNAPTIGQADRSRIFELVGKQLDDIMNGPGSYYPDGVRKAPDALMDDLTTFYESLEQYGRQLNDPDNIMGHVLEELKRFNGAFAPMANWSAPGLQRDKAIELPPELTPMTRDRNYLEIDPFGGPYAPSMPWKDLRNDLNASAEGPGLAASSQGRNAERQLSTRLIYPSARLPNELA